MNLRAAILPRQLSRKPLVALLFLLFAAYAAYKIAGYIVSDDLESLVMGGLAVVVAALVVAILNNWRNGLYFFLVWLLFEDFARKYLGNNMAIYFGKDFLVLMVYISFYLAVRRREAKTFRPPFLIPVLLLVWFGALQVFNPASTSFWFGPLGFKLYFFYMPLIFVGYALLNSEAQFRRFFTLNVVLAVIIVSLGVAQSILGHTFLNPQVLDQSIASASSLYRVSATTGVAVYRPCSVFVSHGRYIDFLVVSWLLVLGFGGYVLLRQGRGRWFVPLAIVVTAAGSLLSASRGSFVWALINVFAASAAFFWGAPWRRREVVGVLRIFLRLGMGIATAVVLLLLIFPEAIGARLTLYSEALIPGSTTSEIGQRTWDYPIRNFLGAFDFERWPYGNGIGTSSLGVQYVARFFKAKLIGAAVESGFGTIVLELGIVGLVLWFVMAGGIVFSGWQVLKKLKGSPWFPVGFVIVWYSFILLFAMTFAGLQAYQDFLLNAYLWLLLGILFRLPSLGLAAEQAALQAVQNGRRRME